MDNAKLSSVYHPKYHDVKDPLAATAAKRILPIVFDVLDVHSVLDVGCGGGEWLAAAGRLGAGTLTGIEGDWATEWERKPNSPLSGINLITQNLEEPLTIESTSDLTICLEVVEHLTEGRADSFVADLCRTSKHVLFSAAIPGQRGTMHINENWLSHWSGLFARHGYEPLDFIRWQIWGEKSIPKAYRQNIILFVHASRKDEVQTRIPLEAWMSRNAIDVVHPEYFQSYLDRPGFVGFAKMALTNPTGFLRLVRRRLRIRIS